MLKSGEHLHVLIDQVLDLSRIEAGRATREDADFSLRELLQELSAMFAEMARHKGVALRVECAADVPELVRTDVLRLRQVLVNLMGNALKFTQRGSVTLSVAAKAEAPGVLCFCVADTGPGIAEEELRQLGSLFMQGVAGARSREGTGLGLAISASCVQMLGGKLELSSEPGVGTRAQFDIPVQPAAQALPRGAERRVVGLAPGQPRKRILVVDDRSESRQLVLRCLQPLGLELREAGDGEQACEIVHAWQPHLVFTDMRMPVLDGWEATRRIRASEAGKDVKIIALTASSFEEERQQILAAGCDDFLSKPWREQQLYDMLRKHLGLSFVYDEAAAAPAMDPARLAGLARPLRESLAAALQRLDVEAVEQALESVSRHDPALAELIAPLVQGFQYQRLAELLQAASEG
jgi:CheY-like chemotaxis protein/two-component sensor histidine kinase